MQYPMHAYSLLSRRPGKRAHIYTYILRLFGANLMARLIPHSLALRLGLFDLQDAGKPGDLLLAAEDMSGECGHHFLSLLDLLIKDVFAGLEFRFYTILPRQFFEGAIPLKKTVLSFVHTLDFAHKLQGSCVEGFLLVDEIVDFLQEPFVGRHRLNLDGHVSLDSRKRHLPILELLALKPVRFLSN